MTNSVLVLSLLVFQSVAFATDPYIKQVMRDNPGLAEESTPSYLRKEAGIEVVADSPEIEKRERPGIIRMIQARGTRVYTFDNEMGSSFTLTDRNCQRIWRTLQVQAI